MILRTYGHRHREGVPLSYDGPIIEVDESDGEDEDLGLGKDSVFGQEHFSQEPLFSSQCSATRFESMSGDGGFGGGRERKKKRVNWGREGVRVTLMETQESGEMIESVDEVNFALDGLRTGQQVRVRRASLGSLLRICGTSQQRRLLRANGMVRTITDALLSLSLDDLPSNLAAVTLLYLLTSDGQDDQLLESPRCIRFLIKMLKPVASVSTENKASKFGLKLLALHKDQNMSRDSSDKLGSSSAELTSKVRAVLLDCKELKEVFSNEYGMDMLDLSPKWIALMTIEKASLTNLALDESSGIVRKTGGNFKEKLCEFGGLDAVFEVSMHCYTVLEGWEERSSSHVRNDKHDKCLSSMVVLLKCLRIMENATFMSKENQIHLLEMRRRQDSKGGSMSFTKLIVNLIKILYGDLFLGLYLLKSIPPGCGNEKAKSYEDLNDPFEFSSISDREDSCNDSVSRAVEQCCSFVSKPSEKSAELPRDSQCRLDVCSRYVSSSSDLATSYRDGVYSSKIKCGSSFSMNSQGEASKHTNGICSMSTTSCLDNPVSNGKKRTVSTDLMLDSDGSQDPFAFDNDEFQPSKWDSLYGKKKPRKSKSRRLGIRNADDVCQLKPRRTQDLDNGEYHRRELEIGNTRQSQEASSSGSISEGNVILVTDCLLSGVKVLMNLTNDNPLGCKQIAACEGLETMASVIASHPVFCSSARRVLKSREKNPCVTLSFQSDKDLSDQELDLLVAILGLLVNLVEKDGSNRARLAKAKVRRHDLEGLDDGSSMDVIPLLCSIFMASRGSVETAKDEEALTWDDEAALLQGEKEAEKMILEAYSALLLAFLSTESKLVRDGIAAYLPQGKLAALVPVLERFVAFHISLDMMTPETHKTVSEVIESCRGP